ncbi:MAG: hypothetical protein JWQ02_2389 [Capsulimonas sp.]|nr:hypothetical protein [Capsulimonas sp.]
MSTTDGDPTSPISSASPSDASQDILTSFIQTSKLGYGDWARFKQLYKQMEANPAANVETLAALIARIDGADFAVGGQAQYVQFKVGRGTPNVLLHNGVAYASVYQWNGPGSIQAFSLSETDPLHPKLLGKSEFQTSFTHLIGCGPHLAGVEYGYGARNITLLDVTNPASIQKRGSVSLDANGMFVSDGRTLAMLEQNYRGPSRLHLIDISNLDKPVKAPRMDIPEGSLVAAWDGVIGVSVGRVGLSLTTLPRDAGLHLIDTRNPQKPRMAGHFPLPGITALEIVHGFAFVGILGAGSEAGLGVIDVRNPSQPIRGAFLKLSSPPSSISIQGTLAYINLRSQKMAIVDLTNINAPQQVGRSKNVWSQVSVLGSKAFVSSPGGRVQALDLTHLAHPSVIGQAPSSDTFAYMKRRARRLLRGLAKTDPAQYVLLAHKALSRTSASSDLDLHRQWVTVDILFGQSDRYRQTRHGRGAYLPHKTQLRLRTREERAPEAWDQRPDLAADLFQNAALPWQVHEFAWKILRDTKTPIPPIADALLINMLTSQSPLLVRVAVRQAAAQIGGGRALAPAVAADAYLRAGVRLRRTIEEGLKANPGNAGWRLEFGRRMLAQIVSQFTAGSVARRSVGGAMLLATLFADVAPKLDLLEAAGPFLRARRAPLTEILVAAARAAKLSEVFNWVLALTEADDLQQDAVTQSLEAVITGKSMNASQARMMVLHASEAVRAAGWRVLAASATGQQILGPIWASLLVSTGVTPELRTAMSSAAALSLLERAGFNADAIAEHLAQRPFLVDLLTPSTFARMTQTLPPAVTLTLIAAASDTQWATLRGGWLRNLQEGVGLEEFWRAAELAVANASDDRLEQRLLLDADVAHTFISSDDVSFLNVRERAFGWLLERWARAHEALFTRDSALLLQAATHILPEVRTWGIARVTTLGMEMPFALRLLESEVPASVVSGRTFFYGVAAGDRQERTYALALCDSPKVTVREIGREFVLARSESLPMPEVLRALFEHDAADMQAFVAAMLTGSEDASPEAVLFDQTVLRARHRGRSAKEQVKARQSVTPTADAPTLLALARGRTARDSEWAYAELAKRALAGETIDGFVLDGPAGG